MAQSVQRLAMAWTVRRSISGKDEIFRTRLVRPFGPPSLLYNAHRFSFLGIKRPGRGINHPPYLAPRLKKEYNYTATSPLGHYDMFKGELHFCVLSEYGVKMGGA